MKQFPILIDFRGTPGPCPSSIPWEAIAPYEAQAKQNHGGQSLERLAERGGLSPAEAFMVMHGRRWELNENIEVLQRESCAFLDKLVRESQIAQLAKERDDALLQNDAYRKDAVKLSKGLYDRIEARSQFINMSAVETALEYIDNMKRLVSELRKNLDEYGQHYGQCPMDRSEDGKPGCTCGLDELLKQAEKHNSETEGA